MSSPIRIKKKLYSFFRIRQWLSSSLLKIELSAMFKVIPAVGITCIVLLLSSLQALKAVNANPVDHLKNE